MSTQPQLSSSVMGWKIWVFLRINQLHNQEKIFSTGTGLCQFSLYNMVKPEGNVRSLVAMIYLPAKLFLLSLLVTFKTSSRLPLIFFC